MKKLISFIIASVLIASFASISASAVDTAVTFSLVADDPAEGAAEFTVDVVASLPDNGDVTQLGVQITVPDGLTLKSCEQVILMGSFETSEKVFANPYVILWASGTKSLPAGDTVIAKLTFAVPYDVVGDVTYDFKVDLDPENMPASVVGEEYPTDAIVLVGTSVTVKGKPVETTTTTATKTEPTGTREPIYKPIYTWPGPGLGYESIVVEVTDVHGNAVTDADGNKVTEVIVETPAVITTRYDVVEVTDEHGNAVTDADGNKVTELVVVTDAPVADTNTGAAVGGNSATTGDNAFIVVAVLAIALGCALIVRRVNAE